MLVIEDVEILSGEQPMKFEASRSVAGDGRSDKPAPKKHAVYVK